LNVARLCPSFGILARFWLALAFVRSVGFNAQRPSVVSVFVFIMLRARKRAVLANTLENEACQWYLNVTEKIILMCSDVGHARIFVSTLKANESVTGAFNHIRHTLNVRRQIAMLLDYYHRDPASLPDVPPSLAHYRVRICVHCLFFLSFVVSLPFLIRQIALRLYLN
jgi:hypothetical protein